MGIWFPTATIIVLAQAAAMPPPTPDTLKGVAEGVAKISTGICYRLATGELRWTPRNVGEEISQIEAEGLTYGAPSGVLNTLGPAGRASANRATLGSRSYGDYHAILALNGAIPGCRVMLAGDSHPAIADILAKALEEAGWTATPVATSKSGHYEQRLFVRFGDREAYRLVFAVNSDPSTRFRVLMSVSSVNRPNTPPQGTVPAAR